MLKSFWRLAHGQDPACKAWESSNPAQAPRQSSCDQMAELEGPFALDSSDSQPKPAPKPQQRKQQTHESAACRQQMDTALKEMFSTATGNDELEQHMLSKILQMHSQHPSQQLDWHSSPHGSPRPGEGHLGQLCQAQEDLRCLGKAWMASPSSVSRKSLTAQVQQLNRKHSPSASLLQPRRSRARDSRLKLLQPTRRTHLLEATVMLQ